MRLIYCPLYPHIACPSLTIQPPSTVSYWCHLQLEGNFAKLKNRDWNGFCLQLNIFKLSFPTLWSILGRTTIVVLPRKDYDDPFSAERKTLNFWRQLQLEGNWRIMIQWIFISILILSHFLFPHCDLPFLWANNPQRSVIGASCSLKETHVGHN